MDLVHEVTTLARSPVGVSVHVAKVRDAVRRGEDRYAIIIEGEEFSLGPDGKDFASKLYKGDHIMIVRRGEEVLAFYGPIQEAKLYVPKADSS